MATESLEQMLPAEDRANYEAITREIQPLIDDESYAQAIARIDMILTGIPVSQDSRLLRAAFLATRGELKLDAGHYEEAEEDLRHAMHNGMRHPAVWGNLGWAHYYMDRPEEAREHFDRVLEEDPDEVSALMGRAMVLQEVGELDKARADLTHALHCDATMAELHALRSEVYMRLGEPEQARKDARRAAELDPRDQDYGLLLARVLGARGEGEEALEVLERALRLEEEPPLEALLLRSHLRLGQGQGEQARSDAMSASNRFPDEAFALVQLAHVQLTEGNVGLARKAADRAVKLDPSLPDAYLVRGAALRMSGHEHEATEDFERASQAPAELPLFLFGPAYDIFEGQGLDDSILAMLQPEPAAQPAAGGAGGPFGGLGALGSLMGGGGAGPGGVDPMKMMGQMFDDQGNLRGPFKPLMRMALKNAPSILKNMPPGMLKNMGGIDPSVLEQMDLENMDPDELEAQMKQFYQMMQSGQDPREMVERAQDELKKGGGQGGGEG